jgi:uncharacterized membrane protein YedE/YeeE
MDKLNFFIIIIFSVLIGLYIHFKYYNKLSKYNKSKFIYYILGFMLISGIVFRFLQKKHENMKNDK